MNDTTFRMATINEIDRISVQIADSYRATYKNMMSDSYLNSLTDDHWIPILQEGLSRGDTCLIAEVDSQLVGSVVYGRSEYEPECADLQAIYLSPHFIGLGLGHRLYSEMEETMQAQRYKSCTLEVLTDNHRAIKFYLDHGYSVSNTFTVNENNMKLECHTMRKQL